MTFEDDFIHIDFGTGASRRAFCLKNGIEWPPPDEMEFHGFKLRLVSRSEISDEARAEMTHVCRGAAYEVVDSPDKPSGSKP